MRTFVMAAGLLALAACESPEGRLDRVLDDAAVCEAGDTCVVAGSTDCSCGQPVNAARVDEVEAASEGISCCDALGQCVAVGCAPFENVRCEAGRCVAD